ncbi:hypothetical protein ABH909_004926 [Pseudomonas sp. BS3782 TE3695]
MNDMILMVQQALMADPLNLALCIALVLSFALLRRSK